MFDQAMINAGVNQPQLNKTNYSQNNLQNNYQYQNGNGHYVVINDFGK